MKKVVLRESKAPYTLAIDDETMTEEPVILERNGRPVAALVPIAEYEAFRVWRETLDELWPEEPPPTPEGDLEALAAVERIRSMFPPLDVETARYIAESEELALDYKFLLGDDYGLRTDDSITLAAMRRHGLTDLASNDEDFKRVTGIRLWTPD